MSQAEVSMELHAVDLAIIVCYLIAVVVIGFLLSKRASEDIDSYFLGGKTIPWYVLGMSNGASMLDITGMMWAVYIFFVYGLKGAWIPWIWPTFNQIFLMIYMSAWVRRSNVLTGAEWITTRFGAGRGGELSRLGVVVFAVVAVVGFLAYAFQGIGKFAAVFLPLDWAPETYAMVIMGITTLYVVAGGMYSVVVTDIIQFVILTVVSVAVGIIAFQAVAPGQLLAAVPEGWTDLFFGWRLSLDWSAQLPAVNERIARDGWELFTIFMMMVLFKGFLVSMAGPAPNYDMQRMLAARTPREAALMSGIVSVCVAPRWFMIAGITVLAIVFFRENMVNMGESVDFEMILPWVINDFLPVGVVGLLLAGLLAAFMSTFDSTVNAGAAYLVNDVYRRYIKPDAAPRAYVRMSYVASVLVVVLGISFGLMSTSINDVMQWMVSGLFGGYTAPNLLKWHWWRFNGFGYFWGMLAGIVAAMAIPLLAPEMTPLHGFPIILVVSSLSCVVASLSTRPDEEDVLMRFYTSVRPWGFWRPVQEAVVRERPDFRPNTDFGRDVSNVAVGIIWQLSLTLVPIYLLVFNYRGMAAAVVVAAVTTFVLKRNWYDRLEDRDRLAEGVPVNPDVKGV